MNFLDINQNDFESFLLSTGINKVGAAEIMQRLTESRADIDDMNLLKRFTEKQ